MSYAPTKVVRLLGESGVSVRKGRYIVVKQDGVINGPVTTLLLHRGKAMAITRSQAGSLGRMTGQTSVLVITVKGRHFVASRCIGRKTIIVSMKVRHSRTGRLYKSISFTSIRPRSSTVAPMPNNINPVAVTVLVGGYIRAIHG